MVSVIPALIATNTANTDPQTEAAPFIPHIHWVNAG
jgi:hypothetical protein